MSVRDQLAALRDAQIRRMHGEAVELPRVVQARKPRKKRRAPRCAKLLFTGHARKRMARRGVSVRQVYLIWQHGEVTELRQRGRTAHQLTVQALAECPANVRAELSKCVGTALIVENTVDGPALVTVLADGEDTYFS